MDHMKVHFVCWMEWCVTDSFDLRQRPMESRCEHRGERSGSTKCCKFPDKLSNQWIPKTGSAS